MLNTKSGVVDNTDISYGLIVICDTPTRISFIDIDILSVRYLAGCCTTQSIRCTCSRSQGVPLNRIVILGRVWARD